MMKDQLCINCKEKSSAACILNLSELEKMGHESIQVGYKKGEMIFKQGTMSTGIKYIKSGLVKVHMAGPSSEKILRLVKAPAYLGIPTTFGDKINQYSATALEDTTVCIIPSEIFKNFILNNGTFAYEIILDLCRNELEDSRRYVEQFQKQVPGRVAGTLLCLANKIYMQDSFEMPLSRNEFADLIGTSRESISRILNDLHNDRIIDVNTKEITILNEEMLMQISEKG